MKKRVTKLPKGPEVKARKQQLNFSEESPVEMDHCDSKKPTPQISNFEEDNAIRHDCRGVRKRCQTGQETCIAEVAHRVFR